MITILTGNNRHELDQKLKDHVADFKKAHGDLAIERFDGEEVDFDTLLGAVSTLPFLATRKLVIVKRLVGNKAVNERIEELVNNTDESIDLIIFEDKPDKRSIYYKTLKKQAGFNELKELDEHELAQWVVKEATVNDAKIDRATATHLVNWVGPNQQKLSGEVQKLALYSPQITKENVEALSDMTPRSSVFNLIDKAFAGDKKAALKLYEEQRQQNVESYSILGLIVWQLHAVAMAKAAGQMSSTELAQKTGLSPYVAGKAEQLAARRTLKDIKRLVEQVVDLEYKSKTSAVDIDEGLKNLIVSL